MINATLLTVFSGVYGALAGLSLTWSVVAIVAGTLFGTIFTALHAVQGPRSGHPADDPVPGAVRLARGQLDPGGGRVHGHRVRGVLHHPGPRFARAAHQPAPAGLRGGDHSGGDAHRHRRVPPHPQGAALHLRGGAHRARGAHRGRDRQDALRQPLHRGRVLGDLLPAPVRHLGELPDHRGSPGVELHPLSAAQGAGPGDGGLGVRRLSAQRHLAGVPGGHRGHRQSRRGPHGRPGRLRARLPPRDGVRSGDRHLRVDVRHRGRVSLRGGAERAVAG